MMRIGVYYLTPTLTTSRTQKNAFAARSERFRAPKKHLFEVASPDDTHLPPLQSLRGRLQICADTASDSAVTASGIWCHRFRYMVSPLPISIFLGQVPRYAVTGYLLADQPGSDPGLGTGQATRSMSWGRRGIE